MASSIEILKIYNKSFRANLYSSKPFRMIGLIDVSIKYYDETERVTLAFYRSSGTNSGKTKGLWYPIVGIKTHTGDFIEFTNYLNFVLTNTTKMGKAKKGWLAKSLFFSSRNIDYSKVRGFSNGKHYKMLFNLGSTLKSWYEKDSYYLMDHSLNARTLNNILTSEERYQGNRNTQRRNFERLIEDIYHEDQSY